MSQIIYVNAGLKTDSNRPIDGKSWATAYNKLQPALAEAKPGDEIWVAEGTYLPSSKVGFRSLDSFSLINNVEIYGGFAGNETKRRQRDWEKNITILDGEIGGNQNKKTDNVYHVVTAVDIDDSAILDGFTIRRGGSTSRAARQSGNAAGGGIFNKNSSPILRNLIITENGALNGGGISNKNSSPSLTNINILKNAAAFSGGGIYNDEKSSPTLTDVSIAENSAGAGAGIYNFVGTNLKLTGVSITNNSASNGGGGIFNNISDVTLNRVLIANNEAKTGGGIHTGGGNLKLTDVQILNNSAESNGGGIHARSVNSFNANTTFTNVKIAENTAQQFGGGIFYYGGEDAKLTNVTIANNKSERFGGGIAAMNGTEMELINTTVAENEAGEEGAGIYNNRNLNVTNSIIWNNSGGESGKQIFDYTKSQLYTVNNSIVQGGHEGLDNIDADPLFVDSANGDFRLQAASPAIDKGDNEAVSATTDADNKPRIAGAAVDLGAYEFSGKPQPANTPPTLTDININAREDKSRRLRKGNFNKGFADADGDQLQSVKITALPTNGQLKFNNEPVAADREIAIAQIGKLRYHPNPNFNGKDSFQWNGSDGTDYAKTPATVNLNIRPTNDRPTITDIDKRGLEDRTVRFGPRNFSNKFADADRRDKLETVKITALPTNGELKFDNEPVAANREIAIADIKKLKYRANPDFHGKDNFQWNGSDGTAYAKTPATANLTIQPVSDRPTVTLTDTDIELKAGEGEQTISAFASFNPGIGEGDQTLERYQVKIIKHGQIFATPPTLDSDGNLKFTPVEQLEVKAGGSDTAKIAVFAIDSGDKENRGQNRSLPVYFNIAVKPGENNDNLQGSKKDDTIDGGGGSDRIIGHSGSDLLIGGDGNDTLSGAKNNDTLNGGLGNDQLVGGRGDDSLLGGEGSDRLIGSSGSDTLIGGGGDDVIVGAAGGDLIVLTPNWGNDTVHKFEDGIDKIKLPEGVGFSDLTVTKDGPHTLISLGDNGLSLRRVKIDLIDETDFAA